MWINLIARHFWELNEKYRWNSIRKKYSGLIIEAQPNFDDESRASNLVNKQQIKSSSPMHVPLNIENGFHERPIVEMRLI